MGGQNDPPRAVEAFERAFEWDEAKSAANEVKHGLSFEAAVQVFLDEDYLEEEDTRRDYGERRFKRTGVVDGVCITLIYTERARLIRIISAWPANRKERKAYGYDPQEHGRPSE